jgi:transposase InsO family protein
MFAVAIGVFRYLSVRRVQLEFNECFALLATANARVAPVLSAAVPYRIHTVLTDNGIQFADLAKNRKEPTARFRGHPFDRVCLPHGIEHRLTKPNHPWTKRSGGADEPHHQRGHGSALPL